MFVTRGFPESGHPPDVCVGDGDGEADEADGDSSTNSSMHSVILFIGEDWGSTGQAAVFNSREES